MILNSNPDTLAVTIYYAVLFICNGAGLALYVLRSVGLFSIAKRRQIRHAWFAWVPIVDQYLLGCVSDQYRYVVRGQNKTKRRSLLALSIICGLGTVAMSVLAFFASGSLLSMARDMGELALMKATMKYALIIGIVLLVFLILALVQCIVRLVALYDLYRSCDPENAVIYLVLNILSGMTVPFFIFFNRNKDLGMPPRKSTRPQHQPEQTASAAWNENG